MFVWVWYYAGSDAPQWSTCFDVQVGGDAVASTGSNKVAAAAYSAPAAAAPAAPATTAAPVAPAPVYEGAVQTVWETVDVWTTVYNKA